MFTLHLPVIAAPSAHASTPRLMNPASRPGALRILLVEDHIDTRRSMVRLLGRKHTVSDVGSVEAALKTARGQKFDLVISDLGLPDGSGLELMKQLREQYGLPGVCLSGFGMEDDLERSADAGFRHHLTKPVDFAKLETIVNSFLPEIGA
jgi:hypothetical protein